MVEEMTEKLTQHSLQAPFSETEWARLEAYIRKSGMKKMAIIRIAVLRYLDEEEQKAGN